MGPNRAVHRASPGWARASPTPAPEAGRTPLGQPRTAPQAAGLCQLPLLCQPCSQEWLTGLVVITSRLLKTVSALPSFVSSLLFSLA